MKYYLLSDDLGLKDKWYLGDINVEDNWAFKYGRPVNLQDFNDLSVELDRPGVEMDFTKTDAYGVPIVSSAFADQIFEYGDYFQLIPISVEGSKKDYYILVLTQLVDCVDEEKSDFQKFEEGNDIRPDKVGEYQSFSVLMLDTTKIHVPIFRIVKYDIAVVVNEEIKQKLENAGVMGLKFKLVS